MISNDVLTKDPVLSPSLFTIGGTDGRLRDKFAVLRTTDGSDRLYNRILHRVPTINELEFRQ